MSFASSSALNAAIADWLNRDDLTAQIPDFVTLLEATLARRLRRRRVVEAIAIAQGDSTFDLTTLTTACAEVEGLKFDRATAGFYPPVTVVTPLQFADAGKRWNATGRPLYATVVGTDLHLAPTSDADYTGKLTFRAAYVSITTDVTQLLEAPDLYLYGALAHAADYLEYDERIASCTARFEQALTELNTLRKQEEHTGAPQPVRLPVAFG